MSKDIKTKAQSLPAVVGQVEQPVRPGSEAPRWWHCDTHGPGTNTAWGCPECVRELRRWKSTHAPRLEALEGLLHAAQEDAQAGREAVATMNSEREANAILTEENERLRNALAELVALYEANEYASPIDEANIRDSSSREEETWKAAKLALKA